MTSASPTFASFSSSGLGVGISEQRLIFVLATVQFVNILDFMMVMPLGPDLAAALRIPEAKLGLVGGAYTLSSFVAGLLGLWFLDRFDRRTALLWSLVGLCLGTLSALWAWDLYSLVAARALAGFFGGPATSVAMSIVADAIPQERRGKAMGAVMGAFSIAAVLGVPFGLELARWFDWRAPFLAVTGLGLLAVALAWAWLPPMTAHLARAPDPQGALRFFRRPVAALAGANVGMVTLASFSLIPNISTYIQHNVGIPREAVAGLYLAGGAVSFFGQRLAGWLCDRWGTWRVGIGATLGVAAVVAGLFAFPVVPSVATALFVGFMAFNSARFVAVQTMNSRIPPPELRAGFQSLLSATMHLASSAGSILSTGVLTQATEGGPLVGMDRLALLAVVLTLTSLAVWARVEVLARWRGGPASSPPLADRG